MSRLIEELLASGEFPGKSEQDLTLLYGRLAEQDKRNDIFLANPDFAQEYETLKDEISRARRPGYIEEFKGAFGSAVDDLQASGYALGALAAHGLKNIGVPGAEPVRNNLLRLMKEQQGEAAEFQPSVPSYEKIANLEDFARYATYGLGTVAPSIAQAAISGLAGAAIGSAVGPEGTIGGALMGLAERRLAQKAVAWALEKHGARIALEEAAKGLPRAAIVKEAKRLAIEYGGQSALAASSIGQEVGSIYGDNPDAPGAALAYGIPAGLLDVLPEAYIASRFLGAGRRVVEAEAKQAVGYFRRFATEAAKVVPMEGSTEAAQTLLEIAAAKSGRGEDPTSFTESDYRQMLNAGIIGAIGGIGMAPIAAAGNARAKVDPNTRLAETVVERLPIGAAGESSGALEFGPGDNLLEGDLGLIEPPTPGPPLAPATANPLGALGETETPDAAFDPFQVARPAYQSAQVFEQNERDPSLQRGVLFENEEGGARGVTPQPVELPTAVEKAVDNVDEAVRAVAAAQLGIEPPLIDLSEITAPTAPPAVAAPAPTPEPTPVVTAPATPSPEPSKMPVPAVEAVQPQSPLQNATQEGIVPQNSQQQRPGTDAQRTAAETSSGDRPVVGTQVETPQGKGTPTVIVPPLPTIAPTGVVTQPTGEQVIAIGDNGVKALPRDSAPNLRRLQVFTTEQAISTTEVEGAAGPRPVESAALGPNPMVELVKRVKKATKEASNVVALIVDNATGQAYQRLAYGGPSNTVYVDMASRRKGTATGQGSTVSYEADFVNGTEGRPISGARGVFAEKLPNGLPRYTVYGIGELTKPGKLSNWNLGNVNALGLHPGLASAAKLGWTEQAQAVNAPKDKLPAVPKIKDMREEGAEVVMRFTQDMGAWMASHPDAKSKAAADTRIAEMVEALVKAPGGDPKYAKGWAKFIADNIQQTARVMTAQANTISRDYVAPVASVVDLWKSTLRALTESRQVDLAAFEQGLMGAVDAAAQTTGVVITPAGRRKILAFAVSALNGPIDAPTIISLLHETAHVFTDGLSEPLRVAFQRSIEQMSWQAREGGAAQGGLEEVRATSRAGVAQPLRLRRPFAALEAMAKENVSWRDWYSTFQSELDRLFGPDAELFQRLLAVTSQNTSVNGNVTLALKSYVQFKNGQNFTGYLPAVSMNLEAVRNEEQVGGRKIGNFSRATAGEQTAITVDRHIAQLFFGVTIPTRAQYEKAEQIIRELAKKLDWTPAQVQAALWAANIRRNGKEPQTYDDYLRRLEGDGRLAGWIDQIRGSDTGTGGARGFVAGRGAAAGRRVELTDVRETRRWLMNPRSLDVRLLANANPEHLSPEQRAALATLTAEEIAAARRIDPAILLEEQMAEHLAQLGWDKSEAKGVVQKVIRFVKDLWLRAAMAIQQAFKGPENISPALARAYVENRFLQFIHRDSALARDRINDLLTWIGAPATPQQTIPVFPAGPDWDQRMQFVDVSTGQLIPVQTANYTPDAQTRQMKEALDRAAQWVAQNPSGSTPDTPALRFTQRSFFAAPFSSTPSITANKQFAQINLEDELYRTIAADATIAPLLPTEDGAPLTPERFATEWLKLPPEQTPRARKQSALRAAGQPDPLTGAPVAHDPEITIDELPSLEQQIVDREGKPQTIQITEAQDDAIDMTIQSLRDTFRRVMAQATRDNGRVELLTREKERQARTKGEFTAAEQYALSRLSEEVLTRQKIALRLNQEINALLEKFRPGDSVKVFPGAELLSVPHANATEEEIRGGRKYRIPLQMTFATADERGALGGEISRGEAWLKNPENRRQGQIYGVISEQIRKLRQIPVNQERAATSAILRKISGGFIDTLIASGLPSLRLMAKRLAQATAFETQYRSEVTTLGHRWSTAFGRFAEAVGRPNDQAFVEEMWDPLNRVWNYIDSSERAKLGTPGEAAIFDVMERALKSSAGIVIQGEGQRAALRALLMQSIERERFFRQIFEQHPELQVYDKELKIHRRLFTHGLTTGSRGIARHLNGLALQMNPAWSDTTGTSESDPRSFWETAGELYRENRTAFDERMAQLFDGYVNEDFVAPLAQNNVALFDVIGSDGEPRKASVMHVRQAWSESGNNVTRFAEILHQLEGAPDGTEGQTVGLVLGNLRERFGALKSILDKQEAAKHTGVETLQRQMLDGREADDFPAAWVSYGTMDVDSNLVLVHQLAMQSAFGPDALAPARATLMGDKHSAVGADPIAAGGEFAESIFAARRELLEIRQRFDVLHRDGLTESQIKEEMGPDDYGIAKNSAQTLAALKHAETDFRQLHSVTNYLNGELKIANNVVGLMATGMIQNPRSGLMQFNAILGMLVDLKFSTQAGMGLRSAIKSAAAELANSVLEAFGQQAAFAVPAAERRQRLGSRDSQTRLAWNEKMQGMGPRNQLGTPAGYEGVGEKIGRTVARIARRGRELIPNVGSPFAKPGDQNLAPKLTAGVFHTITQVAMRASMDAGYDLFADVAARGVEYLQNVPVADRPQVVRELELGIHDLGADELGYFKGILLNDRAAFESLKAAIETQMAGEKSVGDFVAKAYRRMEASAAEAEAGRGDGSWEILSDSQFVDIINYANSQWTLESNFATLPPFMQGRLRPLMLFLTWPYQAMRQAARGFTDAQQRMIWFGSNSTVLDGAKAFFVIAAPATIAGSFAIDWYDKYLLNKRQNLREAPATTAIPILGAALHPQAFIDRWARYGTAGFPSEILNMAVNYDSQRTLSLDTRVVAISAIQNLFANVIKTPFAQEGNLTYGTFGRPVLQAVGAGGVLQYLQIAQNLLGLNTQDAAINARINTGNYLRAAGRELDLPVRVFSGPMFTPTAVTPYLQQMELAALVNNPELFRQAYRDAVQAERDDGHAADAEKRVAENFVSRHPLRRLFKNAVTESDYRQMLGVMGEYGATQVRKAVNDYNRYATTWFGRKAYYGKTDAGGESIEQLIRKATRINSDLERQDSLLATP